MKRKAKMMNTLISEFLETSFDCIKDFNFEIHALKEKLEQ